jgi:hypothetical protein
MTPHVYRTMDDVVDGLGAWEARFRAARDRRSIFLTLYGVVSAEIRARLAQGFFTDNAWVHRYAVAFANLYREALEAYDAGRGHPAGSAGLHVGGQAILVGKNQHPSR